MMAFGVCLLDKNPKWEKIKLNAALCIGVSYKSIFFNNWFSDELTRLSLKSYN
jgi:hypothetical protein